ncbi:MAG: 8-amino-7-oxononanoate synthase [Chloroflexi bacterium]|nr:8-amino-7-oxononanoate synthase [Chloroflexota bacterium]
MYDNAEQELASLEERGLLRDLQALPETGGKIVIEGKKVLNFSSNDYMGLARDQRLKEAAVEAVSRYGCGATASRLLAGHLTLHEELESDLSRMMDTDAALVFGSGFLTNLGVLSSLAGPGDHVFSDRLNHASLIDGIRLSRAHCYRYRHKDMAHLEDLLKKSQDTPGKRIIVSESVFSMDGDIAPLKELSELASRYHAMLIIDEAHAIGVFGRQGGGVCRIPGREIQPDVIIGTLSKALGGYGGFVACSVSVRRLLINKARSFIYSTGLPPACLGSARAAVRIITSEPEPGTTLLEKARRFHSLLTQHSLKMPDFESQILPIIVGGNEDVMRFSESLSRKGLLVKGVRPPTVPPGTARVRLSLTLSMTDSALEQAACAIAEAAEEVGIALHGSTGVTTQ